jgi:tetratricopeptide (TPR) repeat protein
LGNIYRGLGQIQKAIELYQQSLAINKTNGDRNGEGISLGNLGNTYISLKQYPQAVTFYQQALSIFQQLGDRSKESLSYSNLGYAFSQLNQPEVAILLYKQSINVRESIRKDIRGLSKETQASYLGTVASSYKDLADLLLKRGRIMEALQVLDLLKVQELEDYLKNIKGSDRTVQGGVVAQISQSPQGFQQLGSRKNGIFMRIYSLKPLVRKDLIMQQSLLNHKKEDSLCESSFFRR